MAKAFSIARAWTSDRSKKVEGHLDEGNWIGGQLVDPATVKYNTGFTDRDGKEIFEGDFVITPGSDDKGGMIWEVDFNDDAGAFCIRPAICALLTKKDAAQSKIVEKQEGKEE